MWLLLPACDTEAPPPSGTDLEVDTGLGRIDADGDGVTNDLDCDDEDAAVFPGAAPFCDGGDHDCDGVVDRECSLADADIVIAGSNLFASVYSMGGDVDGDGRRDILASERGWNDMGGRLHVYLGVNLSAPGPRLMEDSDHELRAEGADDGAGQQAEILPDVDGDGLDDLFVGAPSADESGWAEGRAYVFSGGALAGQRIHSLRDARTILGEDGTEENYYGYRMAGGGDVDGDGLGDLLLGAREAESVLVLRGADLLPEEMDLPGPSTVIEETGSSVMLASVGDIDGDGRDEVMIAQPGADFDRGVARLFLASALQPSEVLSIADADLEFIGEASSTVTGTRMAAAQDMDGDGRGDVLVSSAMPDHEGRVSLFYASTLLGSPAPSILDADLVFLGRAGDNAFEAAAGGDVDGDGEADLLVCRRGTTGSVLGSLEILLVSALPPSGEMYLDEAALSWNAEGSPEAPPSAGLVYPRAGDLDGDDYVDLLVGVHGDYGDPDNLYVLMGRGPP